MTIVNGHKQDGELQSLRQDNELHQRDRADTILMRRPILDDESSLSDPPPVHDGE